MDYDFMRDCLHAREETVTMKLLNQIRDDAGRLAEQAIPEASTAVDQLLAGDSLAKVVVALVGRLEQDIPGLVHPGETIPAPLTTPIGADTLNAAPDAPAPPVASVVAPTVPHALSQLEQDQARVQALEAELETERAKVAALQSSQTPAPEAPPAVSTQTQEAPAA